MCAHICGPMLKFMKSPQRRGLLGWRPSQERNELIVTLRLLLSISELSTAVDRRRPGLPPRITGAHHQETKQITLSQMYSPDTNQVQQNTRMQMRAWLSFTTETPSPTDLKESKVQRCVKFTWRSRWSWTARLSAWRSLTQVSHAEKQSRMYSVFVKAAKDGSLLEPDGGRTCGVKASGNF